MSQLAKNVEYALQNDLNILLRGKHGVGKTSVVMQKVEELGLKCRYFSASTMDPWVDLIGIPKEREGEDSSYLELVQPQDVVEGDIEVIIFDEFNRSPKAVRNAVMELIQFRSINGKVFPKLKCVVAAINPDDDEAMAYDVEKLDPAQLDRFVMQIDVPYEPDREYFQTKFQDVGIAATDWWHSQSNVVQELVSPRRLDYALEMHQRGGDVRTVMVGKPINISEFLRSIKDLSIRKTLEELISKSDEEKKDFFIKDRNNVRDAIKVFKNHMKITNDLMHYLPEEELLRIITVDKSNLTTYIANNPGKYHAIWTPVLSNPGAYAKRVEDAFSTAKTALENCGSISRDASSTRINQDRSIVINGKVVSNKSTQVVLTGGINNSYGAPMTRSVIVSKLRSLGIFTSTRISSYSNIVLVVGDRKPSQSKINAATRYGKTIITNEEFNKLLDI